MLYWYSLNYQENPSPAPIGVSPMTAKTEIKKEIAKDQVAEEIQDDLKEITKDETITKPFYPLGEGSEVVPPTEA
jgi:hypothetical protein